MKKIKNLSLWISLFIISAAAGCSAGKLFPDEPQIRFVSVTPNKITEGEPFDLTIHYQDGDGDLGYNTIDRPATDTSDGFIKDNRPGIPLSNGYKGFDITLPYLTPETKNRSIQGDITIRLEGVYLVDQRKTQEKFNFSVYIRDRSGKLSNVIATDSLTILKGN